MDTNFKSAKTKLLSIRELKIPKDILANEARFFQFIRERVLVFIERFPKHEEQIKTALEARDYATLSVQLKEVCDRLKTVYAEDLVRDCQKKMAKLPGIKQEVVEVYVTYFLTVASMLSIDLQMVVFGASDAEKDDKNVVAANAAADKDEKYSCIRKYTLLAVDDVSFFLKILEQSLQNSRYNLVAVTSGHAALQYLQDHRPDSFLLDIEMPKMNGYELAKQIRGAGQTAPILFLTSNAQKEYVLRAIEVGAADFVLKPINRDYLLSRIEKHLQ